MQWARSAIWVIPELVRLQTAPIRLQKDLYKQSLKKRGLVGRPGELERCPLLLYRFHPNRTTVTLDKFFDNRQPHAAAFDAVARLQRLEHLKNALVEFFGNAWPIIPDAKFNASLRLARRDVNMTIGAMVMFDCVADEVA